MLSYLFNTQAAKNGMKALERAGSSIVRLASFLEGKRLQPPLIPSTPEPNQPRTPGSGPA